MSTKLSHIGIAVENLAQAIEVFSTILQRDPNAVEEIADQKVKLAIFDEGDCCIELLEGISPDSAVSKFVAKRGPGIHHLSLQVDDLSAELGRLKKAGIRLIDETPRAGAEGTLIAFAHPGSTAGILIELQQKR
jgi:methylmalonyl-CoA/ethylmalonyl-CoA epimerase